MRHIKFENTANQEYKPFIISLVILDILAKVVASGIFRNVISNLIILHLHINWIGNIKIT